MFRYLMIAVLSVPVGAWAADVSVSGSVSVRDRNTSVDISFSNEERQVIQHFYHEHAPVKSKSGKKKGLPPGLAKKGGLPPGLAKKQRLPKDVDFEYLPRALEEKLAPLPSGYVRVRVGKDFAILNKSTRVVLDIALGLTD
jgi:hypothetical protein